MLTCANLACGIFGIILLSETGTTALESVGYLVLLAGIFDFFDGFAARWLKSTSAIGKDLDSLADLVTFGILPTLTVYFWANSVGGNEIQPFYIRYSPVLIGIFSAVRLAIFNNDTRQSDQFIGLPTPANAFFLVFLVIWQSQASPGWLFSEIIWLVIVLIFSFLLISPFPLIALKFKDFSLKNNWNRFSVIVIGIFGIALFQLSGIPVIIISYIVISFLSQLFKK